MTFAEALVREFAPYGQLQPDQTAQLEAHYRLLLRWNAKLNLTRIESFEGALRLHYCESLFVGAMLPLGSLSVADIGSGAGFPGFPIAVLRPECSVTLMESHRRKAVFLREATRQLPNVTVFASRAEDYPGEVDWIVSRAVSQDDVLRLPYGKNRALLAGGTDAATLGSAQRLPWGKDRFIVTVPRETVSRGTLP
jgi:16S rRNA (guanine(527)-N(7))-methyltransferase RsmG